MVRASLFALGLLGCGYATPAEPPALGAAPPPDAITQAAPETTAAQTEFSAAYKRYQQLADEGKREEALPYAQRAYELGLQLFGTNHKNTAALALNYGETLEKTGHRKEAIPVLDQALEIYRTIYGPQSSDMIDPLMDLGNATGTWDTQQRLEYYDQALAIARREAKPNELLIAHLNLEAGIHLMRDGNADDAKRFAEAAYAQYRKLVEPDDTRRAIAAFWLGKYWLAADKPRAAEPLFNEVLAAIEATNAHGNPLEQSSHALLVTVYQRLDEPDKATPHCIAFAQLAPWDGVAEPTPLFQTTPQYPEAAKGLEGYALIEFTIDASGRVRDAKLLGTDGSDAFGEPGLSAISTWRYAPRIVDGKPVDTTGVQTKVAFKLTL